MTKERSIVYIDSVYVNVDHDDAKELADGWEIHVAHDSTVDILHVAKDSRGGWNLKEFQGRSWGRFKEVGDAFMQALDPVGVD